MSDLVDRAKTGEDVFDECYDILTNPYTGQYMVELYDAYVAFMICVAIREKRKRDAEDMPFLWE